MANVKEPSFIAIGVGQGDAFFLKKRDMAVLIDGGRSALGFPTQFQRVTKRDGVDILVCTHNDADHALGVLGFLRSGLTCKEVWLPGSWTDRLEDLLLYPERFTEELILNIAEMKVSPERPTSLEILGDQYAGEAMHEKRDNQADASTDTLSEALEMTREIQVHGDIFSLYPPRRWRPEDWPYPWYRLWRGDHGRFSLFIEAISTATLIREISLAAYHTGALIRWFEYDSTSNNGGIPHVLVPLNAREILRIRVRRWSALKWLALTTSNKQSLVFVSPANDREPAALFTADSDLSFSQPIPWSDGMVITSPHHGSEANAHAYDRFTMETGNNLDVVWTRSDGRFFKTRPGSSYLTVYGARFCTLCRASNCTKQDVRLTAASGRWKPVFTRKCCCV
jgi:hypothetical protein